MYKSPIEIIYGQAQTQIEGDIFRAVQSYAINVDKDELLRALQYDRQQYDKGYADGHRDAMADLVRCKDCQYWTEDKGFGMFCSNWGSMVAESAPDDFCSYGERREGE